MSGLFVRTIWGAWFASIVLFASHPTPLRQLGSMLALLAMIGLVVVGIVRALVVWLRARRNVVLLPVASTIWIVVAVASAIPLGGWMRDREFRRNLPRYETAASLARKQGLGSEHSQLVLPPALSDLAFKVWAWETAECGPQVHFVWGLGFPVKHVVRAYSPATPLVGKGGCGTDWHRVRRLSAEWYELTD